MSPPTRIPNRRSIRLSGYDYTRPGFYFLTLLAYHHQPLFGSLVNGTVVPSALGDLASTCWRQLPNRFPFCRLDEFVLMPDHLHGIIEIISDTHLLPPDHYTEKTGEPVYSVNKLTPGSIGAVIGAYKSTVTRLFHGLTHNQGFNVWHRNYYEHIIRNDEELEIIRQYIRDNPLKAELS